MKRSLLLAIVLASGASSASSVTGRLDYIQGTELLGARAAIKPVIDLSAGRFRLHGEAFLEADAFEKLPYSEPGHYRYFLQEAYGEIDLSPFTLRAGYQSVRWSESWSVPSLDFWTARRWDRYFLDPVAEQLIHPLGVLLRYADDSFELEGFGSFRTPTDTLPLGVDEESVEQRFDSGGRMKLRLWGLDFSPAYAFIDYRHHYGFALSYAFDSVVAKIEAGHEGSNAEFGIAGLDIFIGEFSLFPQLTMYRPPEVSALELITYVPLRYETGPNKFEVQFLRTQAGEIFIGGEYGRALDDNFTFSAFAQDYRSNGEGFISSFDKLVNAGWIGGMRLTVTR